jgi:dTDP-glucose 4,6-dehydratase
MIDKKILITGGSGFIGSNLLIYLHEKYKNYLLVNIDKLTYASNQDYLKSIIGDINYKFIEGDICDEKILEKIFKKYDFDTVINLAAESHVDNSIKDPLKFAKTNVIGTLNLLNVSLKYWNYNFQNKIFYHISTDEVYGTLGDDNYFDEDYKYDPRSPYSASKASSDHFVRAYFHTYSLPILISNCSNNYGPNQFHEKLIPLFIKNIIENKPLPVYGNGNNIRDWIYVKDHIKAIDMILHSNKIGETYNIGGDNEIRNIDLVNQIIQLTDDKLSRGKSSKNLINYVEDRLGHDYRYAINNQKIINELGWKPEYNFHKGLNETIDWYIKKFNT